MQRLDAKRIIRTIVLLEGGREMRPFASLALLLLAFQATLPAENGQTLRERYGQPVAEVYRIRPGVVVVARNGPSGLICSMEIRPESLGFFNTGINKLNSKKMTEIIDEVMPVSERGKYVIGEFEDCLPDIDCGGSTGVWEKLSIFRNGSTDNERFVRITWHREECGTRVK
jgi:hypothetical protein